MMNQLLILFMLIVSCTAYTLETSQIFCMSQLASIVATNDNAEAQDNVVELVPVEAGDRIEMQCQVCSDEETGKLSDEVSPRLWYRRDVEEYTQWQEVQLGMDAPLTKNHIYMTARHSLVIQDFQPSQDAGRYECRGLEGDDLINPIVYLLEVLLPLNATEPYKSGNMSLWTYFKRELEPLGIVLDDIARDESPDVAMHWSSWGPCEDCEGDFGERWRRGRCRMIAPAFLNLLPYNLTAISCRSSFINQLNITDSVHNQFLAVPDFILYEPCKCVHEGVTASESYLKKLHNNLHEGDNLNLMCPGANGHEIVEWKKGLEILSSGVWIKQGIKGRMKVDALGTLHIEHAEPTAAGHYSCHVEERTWRFLVAVEQRFVLTTKEFKHHQMYLITTLGICFVLYLAYLLILCCEAADVRHKIIFGTRPSSATSDPYSDDESYNSQDKGENSEFELNIMESGSQVSGASMSDEELIIVVKKYKKRNPDLLACKSPHSCDPEQILNILSEAEQSDPSLALLK